MAKVTIKSIIENLEKDCDQLRDKLNNRKTVACPHVYCEECAKLLMEQNIEYDGYMRDLNSKTEIIKQLKGESQEINEL